MPSHAKPKKAGKGARQFAILADYIFYFEIITNRHNHTRLKHGFTYYILDTVSISKLSQLIFTTLSQIRPQQVLLEMKDFCELVIWVVYCSSSGAQASQERSTLCNFSHGLISQANHVIRPCTHYSTEYRCNHVYPNACIFVASHRRAYCPCWIH